MLEFFAAGGRDPASNATRWNVTICQNYIGGENNWIGPWVMLYNVLCIFLSDIRRFFSVMSTSRDLVDIDSTSVSLIFFKKGF